MSHARMEIETMGRFSRVDESLCDTPPAEREEQILTVLKIAEDPFATLLVLARRFDRIAREAEVGVDVGDHDAALMDALVRHFDGDIRFREGAIDPDRARDLATQIRDMAHSGRYRTG